MLIGGRQNSHNCNSDSIVKIFINKGRNKEQMIMASIDLYDIGLSEQYAQEARMHSPVASRPCFCTAQEYKAQLSAGKYLRSPARCSMPSAIPVTIQLLVIGS